MRYGLTLALVLTGLSLASLCAAAAELEAADYVEITVARLKLAETTWRETGRGPTEAEEEALFESYDTTAESYYQLAGEKRREIADYLNENPNQRRTIEALSALIRQWIEQREGQE